MSPEERHNKYAPQIAVMIIAGAHNDKIEAMIILESVIVGVLGHFFDDRIARSEILDEITKGAIERL